MHILKNSLQLLKNLAQYSSAILFLTCISCSSSSEMPGYEIPRLRLTKDLQNLLSQDGVEIRGEGGGVRNGKYHEMGYLFGVSVDKSTQDVAREKLITIFELVSREINSRDDLKPYLEQVPFPIEKLRLLFVFNHPDGSFPKDPEILSAFVVRGEIFYNIQAPEQKYGCSRDIIEPYEEARAKVLGLPTSS